MSDLRERLLACFLAVFPTLPASEIVLASKASVGTWDSLATINLVTVIEEEFGLQVEADDLELLVSFELVLDYVEQRSGSA